MTELGPPNPELTHNVAILHWRSPNHIWLWSEQQGILARGEETQSASYRLRSITRQRWLETSQLGGLEAHLARRAK